VRGRSPGLASASPRSGSLGSRIGAWLASQDVHQPSEPRHCRPLLAFHDAGALKQTGAALSPARPTPDPRPGAADLREFGLGRTLLCRRACHPLRGTSLLGTLGGFYRWVEWLSQMGSRSSLELPLNHRYGTSPAATATPAPVSAPAPCSLSLRRYRPRRPSQPQVPGATGGRHYSPWLLGRQVSVP
jgi:hypothetical protein